MFFAVPAVVGVKLSFLGAQRLPESECVGRQSVNLGGAIASCLRAGLTTLKRITAVFF